MLKQHLKLIMGEELTDRRFESHLQYYQVVLQLVGALEDMMVGLQDRDPQIVIMEAEEEEELGIETEMGDQDRIIEEDPIVRGDPHHRPENVEDPLHALRALSEGKSGEMTVKAHLVHHLVHVHVLHLVRVLVLKALNQRVRLLEAHDRKVQLQSVDQKVLKRIDLLNFCAFLNEITQSIN